ncbi:unnamed protein product [Choristocarpus tenellus]
MGALLEKICCIVDQAPAQLVLSGMSRGVGLWQDMLKAMGGAYASYGLMPSAKEWLNLEATNKPSDW